MRRAQLIGNKEKALIHVAKAQLGMSEEDYRAMLSSMGAGSSKELNHVQFDELMRRFEAGGFKSRASKGKKFRRLPAADDRTPLLKKIGSILADAGLSHAYADGIARRMFGVESYSWLNADQLWRLVAALSIWVKRKKKEGRSENEKRKGPDRPAGGVFR